MTMLILADITLEEVEIIVSYTLHVSVLTFDLCGL